MRRHDESECRNPVCHELNHKPPRVAGSLSDLRVGQVVALQDKYKGGEWRVLTVKELLPGTNDCVRFEPTPNGYSVVNIFYYRLVILSDPPPSPVTIEQGPGDDSDVETGRCCPHCRHWLTEHNRAVYDAAWAMYKRHDSDDSVWLPRHLYDRLKDGVQEVLDCCLIEYHKPDRKPSEHRTREQFDKAMAVAQSHAVSAARSIIYTVEGSES